MSDNPDPKDETPANDPANPAADAATGADAASGDVATEPKTDTPAGDKSGEGDSMGMDQIEQLLSEASGSLDQAAGKGVSTTADAQPYNLNDLSPTAGDGVKQPIDILGEVELDLRIELGRTQMQLEEVLQLRSGSVVALDKLAGDPVDVYVNGRLVARGEVLVMNDNFCVRVTELVGA